MSKEFIDGLHAKRLAAAAEAREVAERRAADGEVRAEDDAHYDRAMAKYDELTKLIDDELRIAKQDAEYRQGAAEAFTGAGAPEKRTDDPDAEYRSAFLQYVSKGREKMSPEARALLEARATTDPNQTDNQGDGYLIPPQTLNKMVEQMKAFGGILNVADVQTTGTGNPLNWPTADETAAKGQIINEGAAVTVANISFGQTTLGAYTYSSNMIKLSWQLMQDNVFNLEGYVARKAGERLGRILADHLATGTGSSQPQGLFYTGAVTVGKTTAAGTGAGNPAVVSYDDLIDLEHSVDPAYRQSGTCRFVFNDTTLAALRKVKDGQARPIWQPGYEVGAPSTINGYAYTIDQGVPNVAANALAVGFGDVAEAYVVRQVSGGRLVRLNEMYADHLQTGFFAFLRLDAKVQNASAFKTLKMGANGS